MHQDDNYCHSIAWQRNLIESLIDLHVSLKNIKSIGGPVILSFLDLLDAQAKPIEVDANGYTYSFAKKDLLFMLSIAPAL